MFKRFLSKYPKYVVHSKQYTAPMGGTIGKNIPKLPKLPKWNTAEWKKEKKKNESIWRDWSQ